MKSQAVISFFQKIDETIKEIKTMHNAKADIYFAKFLLVFVCGIYEEIIEILIIEYVDGLGKKELTNFIKATLSLSFRNPNMDNIEKLFKKFNNTQWLANLKGIDQQSKDALNSLVLNKNSLAHGQSLQNLTLSDVENYYLNSKKIIEKIDEMLA